MVFWLGLRGTGAAVVALIAAVGGSVSLSMVGVGAFARLEGDRAGIDSVGRAECLFGLGLDWLGLTWCGADSCWIRVFVPLWWMGRLDLVPTAISTKARISPKDRVIPPQSKRNDLGFMAKFAVAVGTCCYITSQIR